MMTYWVRMYISSDVKIKNLDYWISGETMDGKETVLFAIKAKDTDEICRMLDFITNNAKYEIDFILPKPKWEKYGDFAHHENSRWRLAEKYLNNPIDSVTDVLNRE